MLHIKVPQKKTPAVRILLFLVHSLSRAMLGVMNECVIFELLVYELVYQLHPLFRQQRSWTTISCCVVRCQQNQDLLQCRRHRQKRPTLVRGALYVEWKNKKKLDAKERSIGTFFFIEYQ